MSRSRSLPINATAPKVRFPAHLKSGTWKAVKWRIPEGSFAGWFTVKVTAIESNRPLRDWLWNLKEPMAQYGHGEAWQWLLPRGPCINVWNSVGVEIDG